MLVVKSQASACNEMSLVTQSGALGARSGSLCACKKQDLPYLIGWVCGTWISVQSPIKARKKQTTRLLFEGDTGSHPFRELFDGISVLTFDLAFNFQAENIYNDEELDTPASELEAGASWVNNMRWNLSICSLSSDFRAMFVLKWRTSVSCTKYR